MKKAIFSLVMISLLCSSNVKGGLFTSTVPLAASTFLSYYYLSNRHFVPAQQGNIDGQQQHVQESAVGDKISTGMAGAVVGAFSIVPTLFFQLIGALVDVNCNTFFANPLLLYKPTTLALAGMALGGAAGIYQNYQRRQVENDPGKRDLAYTLNSRETWGLLGAVGGTFAVRALLSHAVGTHIGSW